MSGSYATNFVIVARRLSKASDTEYLLSTSHLFLSFVFMGHKGNTTNPYSRSLLLAVTYVSRRLSIVDFVTVNKDNCPDIYQMYEALVASQFHSLRLPQNQIIFVVLPRPDL